MNKNFKFWAIVDENGICDIKNDKHENLKAVFSNEKDAIKVIKNDPGAPVKIEAINIIKWMK